MNRIHHIAQTVKNLNRAVRWYTENFDCEIKYQDDTWAFLKFENISLALVIPEQHPPHIAFESENAEKYGTLKSHRDGTASTYTEDSEGNVIEIMKQTK